ncbi:hypothetical protein B0A54_03357 [Friedmanniomyces endolithicus]|uniref:Uncharacterized protein n=1 Tax=Friedmanniomyces endolithicus TaxID=329885 RepID=A0A4U0V8W3_9PEZI|nr:hypothetical protein B0A54_03357 [Friedmanniomyces endolithicus]
MNSGAAMAAATATTATAAAGIWLEFAALVGAGVVDAAFGGPVLVPVTAPTLWLEVGVPETGADGLSVAVVIPVPVLSPPAGVDRAGADEPGADPLVYGTGTGMIVLPELVETGAASLLLGTTAVAVVVVTAAAEVEATEEAGTAVVAVVVATLGIAAGEVAE